MRNPKVSITRSGLLLFGSGFCALAAQTAWFKMFGSLFGASTYATAVVMAVFMGGLGLGGYIWGCRGDRHPSPLQLFGSIECGIGFFSGLSPFLFDLLRGIYLAAGGMESLGAPLATLVRMLLTILIVGVPALLMGGSFPAMVRAAVPDSSDGRAHVGFLYGVNTLGACIGAVGATFLLLPFCGIRQTIWTAAAVNLLIGILARRESGEVASGSVELERSPNVDPVVFPWGGGLMAGVAGFTFLGMEQVWYRMLAPILGGSVYTLGIILALILCGIGLGGCFHSLVGDRWKRPTLPFLGMVLCAEALAFAVPFALGDSIAVLTALLKPLGNIGFLGSIIGWSAIGAVVILPAAIVSGFLLPGIIEIVGKGENRLGRETGLVMAWNTGGAILGSLIVGLWLLPELSAPGCWRLLSFLALLTGTFFWLPELRCPDAGWRRLAVPFLIVLASGSLLSPGPSTFWRHAGIGVGRIDFTHLEGNEIRNTIHAVRRDFLREWDGLESSIGLGSSDGYTLFVNGKSDSHVSGDQLTTVGLAIMPALLHPKPQRMLVIGLGTGVTAGWLAQLETASSVRVIELESRVCDVARICGPANFQVLDNPRVKLSIGDAREALLTANETYDLIVSEPSNPYRAGVGSLFTREFYQGVNNRLAPGGVFAQWVQLYEIDLRTFMTIVSTIRSVFPDLEIWQVGPGDMFLFGGKDRCRPNIPALRQRLQAEPFRSALTRIFSIDGLEGIIARYIGGPDLVDWLASHCETREEVNSDDRQIVEYGFARTVGHHKTGISEQQIRELAAAKRWDRWRGEGGLLDEDLVEETRSMLSGKCREPSVASQPSKQERRVLAWKAHGKGLYSQALELWKSQSERPRELWQTLFLAESMVQCGNPDSEPFVEALVSKGVPDGVLLQSIERLNRSQDDPMPVISRGFSVLHTEPWCGRAIATLFLQKAAQVACQHPEWRTPILREFEHPFSVNLLDEFRRLAIVAIPTPLKDPMKLKILESFEPFVPWTRTFLTDRFLRYQEEGHPFLGRAQKDLQEFFAGSILRIEDLRDDR